MINSGLTVNAAKDHLAEWPQSAKYRDINIFYYRVACEKIINWEQKPKYFSLKSSITGNYQYLSQYNFFM